MKELQAGQQINSITSQAILLFYCLHLNQVAFNQRASDYKL